jgi:hypothetical protein
VKMSFALTIKILLAQISVAALQHDAEETELIFFAQGGHTM